ncbi:MAG: hypothetical protein ABL994_18915, partial [Verrucomicrobiales bacterium]
MLSRQLGQDHGDLVLKPIGQSYSQKNVNTDTGEVSPVTIEPASDE